MENSVKSAEQQIQQLATDFQMAKQLNEKLQSSLAAISNKFLSISQSNQEIAKQNNFLVSSVLEQMEQYQSIISQHQDKLNEMKTQNQSTNCTTSPDQYDITNLELQIEDQKQQYQKMKDTFRQEIEHLSQKNALTTENEMQQDASGHTGQSSIMRLGETIQADNTQLTIPQLEECNLVLREQIEAISANISALLKVSPDRGEYEDFVSRLREEPCAQGMEEQVEQLEAQNRAIEESNNELQKLILDDQQTYQVAIPPDLDGKSTPDLQKICQESDSHCRSLECELDEIKSKYWNLEKYIQKKKKQKQICPDEYGPTEEKISMMDKLENLVSQLQEKKQANQFQYPQAEPTEGESDPRDTQVQKLRSQSARGEDEARLMDEIAAGKVQGQFQISDGGHPGSGPGFADREGAGT